jgi:release factor glutamine methyltransferase
MGVGTQGQSPQQGAGGREILDLRESENPGPPVRAGTRESVAVCASPAAGYLGRMTSATHIEFGPLRIQYDDRVLRPRPWTAQQSMWAADLVAAAPDGPVLELCCGAGQIGLLTVSLARRPMVCVDADEVACDYTRRNAELAGLDSLVTVRHGRLEEALEEHERFAVVVADPPWVPRAQVGRYPEDPVTAIDGGPDGLDLARACLRVAGAHLVPGGSALLQVGTRAQVERLTSEPTYGLTVSEVRELDGGVLVRWDRA